MRSQRRAASVPRATQCGCTAALNTTAQSLSRRAKRAACAPRHPLDEMTHPDLTAALKEARELIESMHDVNADGRRLANDLAETIRKIADMQCGAIENRIADLQTRLQRLERKAG